MKREMYVSIPQPCHENWDAMTPQDKGRLCASCAKTVVDFSLMSDTQVLHYLSQSKGRVCGRFAQDQIERPLVLMKKEKKKIWWIAALMPLTLLLNRANGQQKKATKEKCSVIKETLIVQGDTSIVHSNKADDTIVLLTNTIQGNVKDENGNPVPFTTISIVNNNAQTVTDENGNFSLELLNPKVNTKLLFSNINYEQKEVAINVEAAMNIVLKEKQVLLPEVCVKSVDHYLSGRLGGLISVVKVVRNDTIKTTVRKIFHTNPFKVYPNPAARGNAIHIEVKREGHYSIQLLDANSKLITHSLFDAVKGATTTTVIIPPAAAAGMYFIRLVNDDTKQQYTDKIIVQ